MIAYALAALSIVSVASTIALVHAWKHAPEGQENEHGFVARRRARAERAPSGVPRFASEKSGAHRVA